MALWSDRPASWWQRPVLDRPATRSWRSWFTGSAPAIFGSSDVSPETKSLLKTAYALNQLIPAADPLTQYMYMSAVNQVLAQTAPVYGSLLSDAMNQAAREYQAALSQIPSQSLRPQTPGSWFGELPARTRRLLEVADELRQMFPHTDPAYQAASLLGSFAASAVPGESGPATAEQMMFWEMQRAQLMDALQNVDPYLAYYLQPYLMPAMPQWGATLGGLARSGNQRSWWS
jgi:hypothetical protein